MSETKVNSKVGFWVLVGLLAASGVTMAFIAVLGVFDSVASSLVWRIFVADLYLIASFAAQHVWLRRAIWTATSITFVLGIVHVFWRFTPYWEWADGRSSFTVGDSSTGWSPWFGFEGDLEAAGHIAAVGLIMLGFVSLAYRWVAGQRIIRGIYTFTFAAGILSTLLSIVLILDSPHRMDLGSWLGELALGTAILALTGAAIVTISAFVQRRAARSEIHATAPTALEQRQANTGDAAPSTLADLTTEQLRVLVRQHVDEYLSERGR